MNEKGKIQLEQWYDANNDFELLKKRDETKDLCFHYNQCLPTDKSNKNRILTNLFSYLLPHNLKIIQRFYCDYSKNIKFGENVIEENVLAYVNPCTIRKRIN